jgi:hypothetical protein
VTDADDNMSLTGTAGSATTGASTAGTGSATTGSMGLLEDFKAFMQLETAYQ